MASVVSGRTGHYLLLLVVGVLLTLPNLGRPSLWDIDEGLNAEAAREMLEAGTWIVPTFNYELRAAKPVLLYWCQMLSYQVFGINEFGARFPSFLAGLVTMLLTYELARRMFTPSTGLLAGLVVGSAFEVCMLSHAATPDGLLLLFSTLTYVCFWFGSRNGSQAWWIPTAIACGFAVLTKGPVGVALPGTVLLAYFAWNRQLSRLFWDRRAILAWVIFLAIALPWYILVTVETKSAFIKEFLLKQNVNRFMAPMEHHSGPIFYHVVGLFIFFAPWSVVLAVTTWISIRQSATKRLMEPLSPEASQTIEASRNGVEAYRLLLCWIGAYLLFFSLAATKLPNYVLPLYPALAILTARMIDRWRTGELTLPRWAMPAGVGALALVGVILGTASVLLGGIVDVKIGKMPRLEGMREVLWVAAIPLLGAAIAAIYLRWNDRQRVVQAMTLTAVAFTGCVAAVASYALEPHKAPKAIAQELGLHQPDAEIRIGSLVWFQPSLVYYVQRQVTKLPDIPATIEFLKQPVPTYVLIHEKDYDRILPQLTVPHTVIGKRYDLYKNGHVVVLSNPAAQAARQPAGGAPAGVAWNDR
ncbi:ArnT family glycosyltransferase [Tuwongella immobilis]|uniref:Glycosyltransferase RgtA/B/C/D-like domain-containing protein n=1 Tax=Tuwongella immobilis TaxID=692036 RepID=A0A6C2YU76_9BACT|nr:glycosyltransferase family 39 protein [Tuwongella immobilis]VIP04432.1 Hypothetical conserved protein OS=uncultured planctomycete GN=HGMM_F37F03C27 PE=4 SV=1: PMT_2 [Tuwongella immobilis]VTS06226.1 Hypothetical conserved protein OS=uncultured planctomycete GN=HGMM_F37F03C27 PE=4 SV=1: PMT_2 [Tuwongella immobilis]